MRLDSPVTYWLDLDQLTSEHALFLHFGYEDEPTGVTVTIPRSYWVDLGRPSRITAAPWRADA